jgi:hypothetical protein
MDLLAAIKPERLAIADTLATLTPQQALWGRGRSLGELSCPGVEMLRGRLASN